jgi:hypothetical protein
MGWISCSSSFLKLKDEPKHSSNQVPTFVSLMLKSDRFVMMIHASRQYVTRGGILASSGAGGEPLENPRVGLCHIHN